VKATIIIPTTGDRGTVLKFAVSSVIAQTETNWELFIIGDGTNPQTDKIAEDLAKKDNRIYFFKFKKDNSRGELHRHKLITTKAKGEIITYLCDRDLYLPNHIELLHQELQQTDFTHSLLSIVKETNELYPLPNFHINHTCSKQRIKESSKADSIPIPLSFVAHRLDSYLKLPHGWRTTPKGIYTDRYMWQQFCIQPWIKTSILYSPTVIYLKRGYHPGLSTPERTKISEQFSNKYLHSNNAQQFQIEFYKALFQREKKLITKVEKYKKRAKSWWKKIF